MLDRSKVKLMTKLYMNRHREKKILRSVNTIEKIMSAYIQSAHFCGLRLDISVCGC